MPQYIQNDNPASPHRITLDQRRLLDISGAGDVISFDENSVVLKTAYGILSVDGEELHIVHLAGHDLNGQGSAGQDGEGNLRVEGKIAGVFYVDEDAAAKKSFFGRGRR